MLINYVHQYLNLMGDLQIYPIKFHFNELSMADILPFVEVVNITVVRTRMDMFKGKVIDVHIKGGKIFLLKVCAEGIF